MLTACDQGTITFPLSQKRMLSKVVLLVMACDGKPFKSSKSNDDNKKSGV